MIQSLRRRCYCFLILLAPGLFTIPASAQSYQMLPSSGQVSSATTDLLISGAAARPGVHLDSAMGHFGASVAGLGDPSLRGSPVEWDQNVSGEATFSIRSLGQRGDITLIYRPSFVGWRRNTGWNSVNQSVLLKTDYKLSGRWKFALDAGGLANGSQVIILPSPQGGGSAEPAASGQDSAASAELVRIYAASARAALTHTLSPRLSVQFGLQGEHYESGSGGEILERQGQGLFVSRTSSVRSDARLSYRLSPRTDAGFDASANRYWSNIRRATVVTGGPWLRRSLAPDWSVQVRGGVTAISAAPGAVTIPGAATAQKWGGLAAVDLSYASSPHRLTFSGERTSGDPYGLGAQSNVSASGSWTCNRPGRSWGLLNVARFSQLNVAGLPGFHTWQVESGYTRLLNSEVAAVVAYTYGANSSRLTGVVYGLSQQGVRLSFAWSPESVGFR